MNIDKILEARQGTHGHYVEQAILACTILDVFESGKNWRDLNSAQQYALIMIAGKIARILSGNPDEIEHYADISGYATLVVRSLEEAERAELCLSKMKGAGHE